MWLPKDERHLLMGYYVNMFNISVRNVYEIEKPKWFQVSDWTSIFEIPSRIPFLTPWLIKRIARKVKGYFERDNSETLNEKGGFNVEHQKKKIKESIKYSKRLLVANTALEQRKLIKIHKHKEPTLKVAGISLTIDGYDLGIEYSNWLTRTGLWFAKYRKHWIWVVVSFFVGVIVTELINWLCKI